MPTTKIRGSAQLHFYTSKAGIQDMCAAWTQEVGPGSDARGRHGRARAHLLQGTSEFRPCLCCGFCVAQGSSLKTLSRDLASAKSMAGFWWLLAWSATKWGRAQPPPHGRPLRSHRRALQGRQSSACDSSRLHNVQSLRRLLVCFVPLETPGRGVPGAFPQRRLLQVPTSFPWLFPGGRFRR